MLGIILTSTLIVFTLSFIVFSFCFYKKLSNLTTFLQSLESTFIPFYENSNIDTNFQTESGDFGDNSDEFNGNSNEFNDNSDEFDIEVEDNNSIESLTNNEFSKELEYINELKRDLNEIPVDSKAYLELNTKIQQYENMINLGMHFLSNNEE